MKAQPSMQANQLKKFALFLEIHPSFYPELEEETVAVWGFRVGSCFLTIGEMDTFIASRPHFNTREAALLLATQPTISNWGPP